MTSVDDADQAGRVTAAGSRATGDTLPTSWLMAAASHGPLGRDDGGFVAIEERADPDRDANVRTLRLRAPHDARLTRLPSRLHDFPNLTDLTIGPYVEPDLVKGLDQGGIPGSVTTLTVLTGGRPTRWPKGLSLPAVRSYTTDGPSSFSSETFPHLELAHLAPTKTSMVALLALPTLSTLQMRTVPLPAPEIFEAVAHLPLVDLGLLGGRKITDLTGIDRLPGLRRLRLQSLPALTSIAALESLEHLEELRILYCSRIQDVETVTRIPSLSRFDAHGCQGIGLEALGSFLDEHSAHRGHRALG